MAGFSERERIAREMMEGFAGVLSVPSTRLSKEDMLRIKSEYEDLIRREKSIAKTSPAYWREVCGARQKGVKVPSNKAELKLSPLPIIDIDERYECQVAKYPFSMGACRAAYFAKIRDKGARDAWEEVVLKEFLFPGERRLEKYAAQAENSAVGHFLATEYSKSHRPSKAIDVIKSRILTVSSTSGDVMYNMEEKLEGSFFKRWTNNIGFISEKNRDLLDFSKWSYDISGGYLIFTDIQGMELAREIKLSDPAILCTDIRRFGSTNYDPDVQIPKCYDAASRGESAWRATEMTSVTVRSDPSLSILDPLHPIYGHFWKSVSSSETVYFRDGRWYGNPKGINTSSLKEPFQSASKGSKVVLKPGCSDSSGLLRHGLVGLVTNRRYGGRGICLVEVGNYYGVYLISSLIEVSNSTPLSVRGFSEGDRVKISEEAKKAHTNRHGVRDHGGPLKFYGPGVIESKWNDFPEDSADGEVYNTLLTIEVGGHREKYYGYELVKLP